jgi:hypothetical protein
MKFSSSAITLFAASAVVSACPLVGENYTAAVSISTSAGSQSPEGSGNSTSTSGPSQNSSKIAGAAYCKLLPCPCTPVIDSLVAVITNRPDGNFIVGSDIGSDGKLTFNDAISAGGRGSSLS